MERSLQKTLTATAALVLLSFAGIGRGGPVGLGAISIHDGPGQPAGPRADALPGHQRPGTVAVLVEDPLLGVDKLITKRDRRDAPVVVADTERVANSPTFCDNGFTQITSNPSINELAEVAFQGNLRRLSAPRPAPPGAARYAPAGRLPRREVVR